jgi:hypothetical protein
MKGMTRKGMLGRGLALVGGLAGAGAAARGLGPGDEETLVLHVRERMRPPASPEQAGERLTLVAELYGRDGAQAGNLYGAGFALRGPGEPAGPSRLELHTLELADGSIVGTGTIGAGTGDLLEGSFAILGGTGRYAGARGTYVVRRPPADAASSSDAELLVRLTP